ncbi:MAG: sugar ABC transporter substrate-binding protein [Candidatus Eisenbacteria bacterium]|nr:sugar ABC transporter substrate-binding protein [Candidatus Eisenbacteria bacterium]
MRRAGRALPAGVLMLVAALFAGALSVSGCARGPADRVTLRFWAMGREGEVLQDAVAAFERQNPGIHVVVQQIPWGAAHEKMLTAHVGRSTPDAAQLGNTWVSEFAALRAIEPLDPRIATSRVVRREGYFRGIWDTNVIDGVTYGVPWYVDTRLLFYRRDLLARAGYPSMPTNWRDWREAMRAVKRLPSDREHFAIFLPTNEYTPWIVFGMQAGSPFLKDDATRGAFSDSAYRAAMDFYLGLFRERLAPAIQGQGIANLYQEFERGTFAMYITGPWQLGEFRNRISPAMRDCWATAPLPGPTGPASGVSTAGGSSLVLFRESRHKEEAWKFVEFLSRPEQQLRFYHQTGDLPARVESWADTALRSDPNIRSFGTQLERVLYEPRIPEWQQISIKLMDKVELAILGHARADSVLAGLDREVDQILEKRRWLVEKERRRSAGGAGGAP